VPVDRCGGVSREGGREEQTVPLLVVVFELVAEELGLVEGVLGER
jgi:hypothetical protein